ncbi:MerR family transcriptional regulator [Streptomyces sp. NPDC001381]
MPLASAGSSRCIWVLAADLKIGEASRVSGVSARSLRHYEHEGLIVPGRRSNGFRDYCPSAVDRVLVIRSLLESGLPVRLIREVLPRLMDESDAGTEGVCAQFAPCPGQGSAHRCDGGCSAVPLPVVAR